jgi:hypothetical protein
MVGGAEPEGSATDDDDVRLVCHYEFASCSICGRGVLAGSG